jgi:hypothetical protein
MLVYVWSATTYNKRGAHAIQAALFFHLCFVLIYYLENVIIFTGCRA